MRKRILLSLIGGIFLPFLYLLIVGLIVYVVKSVNGEVRNDSSWFWLVALPFEGGGRLYNLLFPAEFEKPYALLKAPAIWSDIIGSFLLFGVLTYACLWWRSNRRRFA